MRRLLIFLFAIIAPLKACAQGGNTTVTATVKDPVNNLYTRSQVNITFYDPGTSGKLPLLNGSTFQKTYSIYATDSFGVFSVSLPDNGIIDSSSGTTNTQWNFNICYSDRVTCFTYRTPINCSTNTPATCSGGSMDISAQLKAVAALLIQGTGFPYITSGTANPAQSGFLRLASTDLVSWRNNANSAEISLGKNANDSLTYNDIVQPQVVAVINRTGQNTTISPTTMYTTPATGAGAYRASISLILTVQGGGGNANCTIGWNNGTTAQSSTTANLSLTAAVGTEVDAVIDFYSAASQAINYAVSLPGVSGTPQYSIRIRLEYLGP